MLSKSHFNFQTFMNTHIITKFTVIFNLESKCCHLCLFE